MPRLKQEAEAETVERIREDRATTLLRQIERCFGAIDEHARARVTAAPAGQLERWLDAILDAPSLDALLAG